MTITELASLVRKMRHHQRNALIYRTPEWKKAAEDLEQQVDDACAEIISGNQQTLKF
jgi:cell fate (sporulation/competence/biofilm development) regulator YmcA (YheA/YmcA/DUF963 family)